MIVLQFDVPVTKSSNQMVEPLTSTNLEDRRREIEKSRDLVIPITALLCSGTWNALTFLANTPIISIFGMRSVKRCILLMHVTWMFAWPIDKGSFDASNNISVSFPTAETTKILMGFSFIWSLFNVVCTYFEFIIKFQL